MSAVQRVCIEFCGGPVCGERRWVQVGDSPLPETVVVKVVVEGEVRVPVRAPVWGYELESPVACGSFKYVKPALLGSVGAECEHEGLLVVNLEGGEG